MKRMSSEKKYPLYGNEIKVASKSEQYVGNFLIHYGYKFLYDQEYKLDDSKLRYDFMILNKTDDEKGETTKHHLYIEVKDDDKNYKEELNIKQNLVHDAKRGIVLIITDGDQTTLKDKIERELDNVRNQAKATIITNAYFRKKIKK